MHAVKPLCIAAIVLLNWAHLAGRVLHVPTEYATIQAAIDSSANNDTIQVESGLYQEALNVTNRSLMIIGTSTPDTISGTGVIIDPSNSIFANEISCLTLHGGDSVKLERLWFKNGPAMHIERATNDPGGIDNERGPRLLALKACRFDSVHIGIGHGLVVTLDSVVMYDMQRSCMMHGDTAKFVAVDCRFEGAMTGIPVTAWTGSQFRRCKFSNSASAILMTAGRDSLLILECDFGPSQSICGNAVVIRPGTSTVIENNFFHDIITGGIALHVVQGNCSTTVDSLATPGFEYVEVRRNHFTNIGFATECQYGLATQLGCTGTDPAFLGTIVGNTFENIESRGHFGTAINIEQGAAYITDNRLRGLDPSTCGVVYSHRVQPPETLVLRDNEFDSLAFAVEHSTWEEITDARWNWWGDNSGPYNPSTNPAGLGAEVDNNVLYDPWIVHEDTTDTNGVSIDRDVSLAPVLYQLSAYPNPFNSTTTLEIEVSRAGAYSVVLYDVTGRIAARVFSGRIEREQTVRVNGTGLASGVYFARLSGGDKIFAVGKILLIR